MNAPVSTSRFDPVAPAAFADVARVRVRCTSRTDEDVSAGKRGTIVAAFDGGTACEFEFEPGRARVSAADLVAA